MGWGEAPYYFQCLEPLKVLIRPCGSFWVFLFFWHSCSWILRWGHYFGGAFAKKEWLVEGCLSLAHSTAFPTILSLVGTKTVTFPQGTRALTKSQMIPKSFLVPMNASDPTVLTYNHYQMLLWGESEILKMSMSASVSPFRILTFFLPDLLLNFTHATDPVFIPLLSTQNTGEWMAATQPLEACCPRLLNRDWGSRGIVPFKYRPLLGSRGDIFFYCIRFCLKTQDVGCSLDEGQTRLKRGTYWAMRNSWELQR